MKFGERLKRSMFLLKRAIDLSPNVPMRIDSVEAYRVEILDAFRNYKDLAERALEQISSEEYFQAIDRESNSIAVIVKHIAGNLRSRWTDFLTSDGEKPDRDRDSEFVCDGDSQESLKVSWDTGWKSVLNTLESLNQDDFSRTVMIRGEGFSVSKAINRSLTHTAYHVGQIVFLAKFFCGSDWRSLSIPRGQSKEFNVGLMSAKTSENEHTQTGAIRESNE